MGLLAVGPPGDSHLMNRHSSAASLNGAVTRRSEQFLAGLADVDLVTFVTHVHPDPDGLGSMLGLAHLVETTLGKSTRLTRDGEICRAENQAMVDLLEMDLEPIEEARWHDGEALVMVDSQPKTGRHTLDPRARLYAVIDHHQTPGDLSGIPYQDIRRGLGATCSIVTAYMMEQRIDFPERVATALYYGIDTELNGFPREASPLDDTALQVLFPLANKDMLARIRNAPRPQAYYECILQALQSSFIYDRLLISWVHEMAQPELAAQVVDFMIRFEEVDWALCAGVHHDRLILSARSVLPHVQAGEVLRQVVAKLGGRAGGHDRRAGGYIPLPSTSATAIEQVQSDFRRRLLKALDIDECRGQRLVSRREMLHNLHT